MADSGPVLIIGQHDDVRDLCVGVLSRAGYRCLPARTAAAGLRYAAMFRFAVVIIDLALPTCQDGLRLAAELRVVDRSAAVIALSDGRHQAATFICAQQVPKPIVGADLLAAVRRVTTTEPAA